MLQATGVRLSVISRGIDPLQKRKEKVFLSKIVEGGTKPKNAPVRTARVRIPYVSRSVYAGECRADRGMLM